MRGSPVVSSVMDFFGGLTGRALVESIGEGKAVSGYVTVMGDLVRVRSKGTLYLAEGE